MKKSVTALIIFIFLPAAYASLPAVSNYTTYYGSARLEEISRFDLAFLESNNYNAIDIQQIKNDGTLPLCYITIGEDDVLHVGDGQGPGNYASWYLDADSNNQPDQNPFWLSYYVNASNPAWQDRIINQISSTIINQKGCSGLFLDTIDTIDLYPSTTSGMISLISSLNNQYPSSYLVANRGFSIASEISSFIDGIMFESFSSRLVTGNKYQTWTGQDLDWTSSWGLVLREIQQEYPIKVFALDYSMPREQSIIDFDYNRALDYGFIPYVSTINLDNIYFHAYTRTPGILPDGYTDPIGDVTNNAIDITSISIFSTRKNIQFALHLNGISSSSAYYGLLLDADFRENTGYKSNAIGADYLLEGNSLYIFNGANGNDWSWQPVRNININQNGNEVSWNVNYDKISSGKNKNIAFNAYAGSVSQQDNTVRGKYKTYSLNPYVTTTSYMPISIISNSTSTSTTTFTTSTSIQPTSTSTSTTSSSTILPTTLFMIPTAAIATDGREQISPDNGSLDGTVDLSNNDARWLTNDNEYIQVTSWNNQVPNNAIIQSSTAYCEIDFTNNEPGNLVFSLNTGSGWQQACSFLAAPQSTYTCNMLDYGLNNPGSFNNLLLRCSLSTAQQHGSIGFSIDAINMRIIYE